MTLIPSNLTQCVIFASVELQQHSKMCTWF